MSDLISREKAIDYFVTNIGVVDADGYAVDDYDERVKIWTERFSGIPSAKQEMITIEELSNQLGCATIQSALYWLEFLKTLDLLGFAIIRKETK